MEIKREIEVGIGDKAVLEFHLSGIQHHIKKAVLMRAEALNALIDAEVAKAFTVERIETAIAKQVEIEFERSMTYGEGAAAVREIVAKQIAKTIARLTE